MDGSASPRSYRRRASGGKPISCDVTAILFSGRLDSRSLRSRSENSPIVSPPRFRRRLRGSIDGFHLPVTCPGCRPSRTHAHTRGDRLSYIRYPYTHPYRYYVRLSCRRTERARHGKMPLAQVIPCLLDAGAVFDGVAAPVLLPHLHQHRDSPHRRGWRDRYGEFIAFEYTGKGHLSVRFYGVLDGFIVILRNQSCFLHGISFKPGCVVLCSSAHRRFQQAARR